MNAREARRQFEFFGPMNQAEEIRLAIADLKDDVIEGGVKTYLDKLDDFDYEGYLVKLENRQLAVIDEFGVYSQEHLNLLQKMIQIEEKIEENTRKMFEDMFEINIGESTRDFQRLMQTNDGTYVVDPKYIDTLLKARGGRN